MQKLLMLALLVGGAAFGQISVGIRIGQPPPPARVIRVQPRAPGPGYIWVDGYWYANGNSRKYKWHDGYYTRPPYEGAVWMQPRYEGGQFFDGYWVAGQRQMPHDHKWDRDRRNRDYGRDNDRNGRNDRNDGRH